jgi:hypothetical protein
MVSPDFRGRQIKGLSRVASERPDRGGGRGSAGEIIIWQFLTEDLPLRKLQRVAKTETKIDIWHYLC